MTAACQPLPMATEDERARDTTGRASLWVRGILALLGLSLTVDAVRFVATYGAKFLAGAGWVGTPGRFEVESCVDVTTQHDRYAVRTRYCSGTFHPDDAGPGIEHVLIKGGRGDAYAPPSEGSWCSLDTPHRPSWCGDGQTSVAARYVHGEAWTFGSGMWVPGSIAVLGLCGFVLALLLILCQLVWPDPGRRPRWLRRRVYNACVVGAISFVVLVIALAFEVNS